MITIDVHERQTIPYFKQFIDCYKVEAIEYSDYMFEAGDLEIGIERKTISDFVNSYMSNRLIGRQLSGMANIFDRSIVILEGAAFRGSDGDLETFGRRPIKAFGSVKISYETFLKMLFTIQFIYDVQIIHTLSPRESARTIHCLYKWFNAMDLDKVTVSKTHIPMLTMPLPPTAFQKVAFAFDGVGPQRSADIPMFFDSIKQFINSSVEDIAKVTSLGNRTAHRIYNQINQKYKDGKPIIK